MAYLIGTGQAQASQWVYVSSEACISSILTMYLSTSQGYQKVYTCILLTNTSMSWNGLHM